VGTSLVNCTDAVAPLKGFGMNPTKNSRPLLSITTVAESHWLVSRLQSGAQARIPPPRPSDVQVAPRRSERSQLSEAWFAMPSPQVAAALHPLTL